MWSLRLFGFCLFALTLVVSGAAAQPPKGFSRGFGISPSRLSVKVRPGGRTVATFNLSNLGTRGAGLYSIEVSDLGQRDSGTVSPVPRGQGTRSCADWLEVPVVVEVPSGSFRKIEVPIRCPPGAKGAYYAILKVAPASSSPAKKAMVVVVQPTIGVSLEVQVSGPAPSHLDTKDLLYEPGVGGTLPSLVLKIENTGVWKKSIEGDVLIYDRVGQFPVRTSIPYKSSGKAFEVYPNMSLTLRCPLPRPLKSGKHRVFVKLRLTDRVQARKELELEIPTSMSATAPVVAHAGGKSELDVALSVEPPLIEVVIPPGGRRIIPIRVRNDDIREAHIYAKVTQARVEPNGMLTYLETAQSKVSDWLTVSRVPLTVAPNRSTVVRAQAVIPKAGSSSLPLVGVVRFQAEAAGTEYNEDWSSGGDFSVFIVVLAPKTPPASLETVSFNLVRLTSQHNPGAAVLRVKNTGGKVARAYGRIVLERTSGVEIAHMDIGSVQPELILPGSEREFRMPLPPLDRGEFRVRAEIAPGQGGRKSVRTEKVFTAGTAVPKGLKHP